MSNKQVILKFTSQVIFLAVLGVLVFTLTKGYFHSDDFSHLQAVKFKIVENPALIFSETEISGHYRPMVRLFWWVSFSLFGLNGVFTG